MKCSRWLNTFWFDCVWLMFHQTIYMYLMSQRDHIAKQEAYFSWSLFSGAGAVQERTNKVLEKFGSGSIDFIQKTSEDQQVQH